MFAAPVPKHMKTHILGNLRVIGRNQISCTPLAFQEGEAPLHSMLSRILSVFSFFLIYVHIYFFIIVIYIFLLYIFLNTMKCKLGRVQANAHACSKVAFLPTTRTSPNSIPLNHIRMWLAVTYISERAYATRECAFYSLMQKEHSPILYLHKRMERTCLSIRSTCILRNARRINTKVIAHTLYMCVL